MDSKYISKSELARANGVSAAYISKLFKKGIFEDCMEGKKILRDCALARYLDIKDPARDNQRASNRNKKLSEKSLDKETLEKDIDKTTSETIKKTDLYNADNIEELESLLLQVKTANQKVQLIKDFWAGKLNKQKFLKEEGELLPLDDAKKAVDKLLTPLNQYLNDQGNNLKNHFPDLPKEVVEWINKENNRQKEQLREKEWED